MIHLLSVVTAISAATTVGLALPLEAHSFSGSGTWYDISVGYTACGNIWQNTAYVVAVSSEIFNTYPGHTSNPNLNPICKQTISISGPIGTVTALVNDICPGCAEYDIDMTSAVFQATVGALSIGRAPITWSYN